MSAVAKPMQPLRPSWWSEKWGSLYPVAAERSQQHGLLHNDALIVAVMQANSLTNLASEDDDFDRVPGLTRYAPV